MHGISGHSYKPSSVSVFFKREPLNVSSTQHPAPAPYSTVGSLRQQSTPRYARNPEFRPELCITLDVHPTILRSTL